MMTWKIFSALPTQGEGKNIIELEEHFGGEYTRRQIQSAISHLKDSAGGIFSDGGYPARYTRDPNYSPPTRTERPKPKPPEKPLKRYHPPMRPLQGYGDYLFSHYQQCARGR